jgi:hypothetical protein
MQISLIQSRQFGDFVQPGDLITRRKCVNHLVETILHQVSKGRVAS